MYKALIISQMIVKYKLNSFATNPGHKRTVKEVDYFLKRERKKAKIDVEEIIKKSLVSKYIASFESKAQLSVQHYILCFKCNAITSFIQCLIYVLYNLKSLNFSDWMKWMNHC